MIGGIAATACADAAGYLLPAIIAGRRLIIAGDRTRDAKLTRRKVEADIIDTELRATGRSSVRSEL